MQPSSTLITFRLAKFSFADEAPVDAQQFNWKHRTQDLVVAIDNFRGAGIGSSSQVLKVLQGTQVLVRAPALARLDTRGKVEVCLTCCL